MLLKLCLLIPLLYAPTVNGGCLFDDIKVELTQEIINLLQQMKNDKSVDIQILQNNMKNIYQSLENTISVDIKTLELAIDEQHKNTRDSCFKIMTTLKSDFSTVESLMSQIRSSQSIDGIALNQTLTNTYTILSGIGNINKDTLNTLSTDIVTVKQTLFDNNQILTDNKNILLGIEKSTKIPLETQSADIAFIKQTLSETNQILTDIQHANTFNEQATVISLLKEILNEIGTIKRTHDLTKNEIDTIQNTLALTKNEIGTIHSTLDITKNEIGTIHSTINLTNNKIGTMHSTLDYTKNEIGTIHSTIDLTKKEIGTIHSTLDLTKNKIDTIHSNLALTKNEIGTIHSTLDLTKNEIDKIHNTLVLTKYEIITEISTLSLTIKEIGELKSSLSTNISMLLRARGGSIYFEGHNLLLPSHLGGILLTWQESIDRCEYYGASPFKPETIADFRFLQTVNSQVTGSPGMWLPAKFNKPAGYVKWFDGESADSTLKLFDWQIYSLESPDSKSADEDCYNIYTGSKLEFDPCTARVLTPMVCEYESKYEYQYL